MIKNKLLEEYLEPWLMKLIYCKNMETLNSARSFFDPCCVLEAGASEAFLMWGGHTDRGSGGPPPEKFVLIRCHFLHSDVFLTGCLTSNFAYKSHIFQTQQ